MRVPVGVPSLSDSVAVSSSVSVIVCEGDALLGVSLIVPSSVKVCVNVGVGVGGGVMVAVCVRESEDVVDCVPV